MIAFRSALTTVMVRCCLTGSAALPLSHAVADADSITTSDIQQETDLFEAFQRDHIENLEVNLLLHFPLMADGQFLDIDMDGHVNGDDLDTWYGMAEVEQLADDNKIVAYVYNALLDVNEDGLADNLDSEILRLGIAKVMAERGEALIVGGMTESPDREIVAFDGVVVTLASMLDLLPDESISESGDDSSGAGTISVPQFKPDHRGVLAIQEKEEFPGGEVKYDHPFPAVTGYSRAWNSWGGECGGTNWRETANAAPSFHSPAQSHLGCGLEGPDTISLQITKTITTTLSLAAKAGFDTFGSSLGLTWEAASSTTVTQGSLLVHGSDVRYDDTAFRRYIGYNLTYTMTRTSGNTGCHDWLRTSMNLARFTPCHRRQGQSV